VFKDMLPMDPVEMQRAIHETVQQALQDNLGPIVLHLKQAVGVATSPHGPPGATGQLPVTVPNIGEQAARPGGQAPNVLVPSSGGAP
jgi:hypothetical protein